MIQFRSIRAKLLAIFFATAVVPIAALSAIFYHNSLKAVADMVGHRTESLAESVNEDLTHKLVRQIGDPLLMVNQPVQGYLDSMRRGSSSRQSDALMELRSYVPALFEEYGAYYDELVLADTDGNPLLKFNREGLASIDAARAMAPPAAPAPPATSEDADTTISLGEMTIAAGEGFSETLARKMQQLQPMIEAAQGEIQVFVTKDGEEGTEREELSASQLATMMERIIREVEVLPPVARSEAGFPTVGPMAHPRSFSDDDGRAARMGRRLDPGEFLLHFGTRTAGWASMRLVRPVFSVSSPDRRLGTLITRFRREFLFPADLESQRFGDKGELAVINKESGEILYHSRKGVVGRALSQVDPGLFRTLRGRDRDSPALLSQAIPGEAGERLASAYDLDGVPWTVVATAFPGEFDSEAEAAGLINLFVSVMAILAATVVLLLASRRISNSIKVVTAGARSIAEGNLNETVQVETHDEIQTLAETFDGMRVSLKESIALREEAAEELDALNQSLEDRVQQRTQELEALNAALNKANQDLKELDALKSNFLATVSHEFKTPLTSIKAFAEILLDEAEETNGSDDTKRFLRIINSESDRLGRLIKNLLDLSRIESRRMVWRKTLFPIRHVVDVTIDSLLPVFDDKSIDLKCDIDCGDAPIYADQDRIQEVLTNVLHNAVKVSAPGKQIQFGCRKEGVNGTQQVKICIRDEGHGIPPDQLENIFDRFSQVDSSRSRLKGGTGLGLAISREIVEHHGGRIWAESLPGEGATFHITLPVSQQAVTGPAAASPQQEEPHG